MTPQRPRVELRSPTPADRDEFLGAMRASRKFHRPWVQSPITDEAYDELLVRVEDERSDPLLVCLRDGGAIVGYMNISQIVRRAFQSAFLGGAVIAALGFIATLVLIRNRDSRAHVEMANAEVAAIEASAETAAVQV